MKKPINESHMSTDTRLAVVETQITNINMTLMDIRHELKEIRHELKDTRTEMNNRFDVVHNRLWSNFLWLMGMIVGLAGLIAHSQDWI
ncbi:MAG TPA: hypothetical protein VHA13_04705 [Gammaproteobacteria bacterium]|nr:hypothetical protein [Gammaproteobacteria bacterium]